jgi:NodT family efflux transporter outer membrane factor (OMF) lipoprotein
MRGSLPLTAALLVTGLAGCAAVGPDYQRPRDEASANWSATQPARPADVASPVAVGAPIDVDLQWWRRFGDPVLDALEQDAAAQNLDVQTAVLRIELARAQLQAAQGRSLPSVDMSGIGGRARMSEHGPLSGSSGASAGGAGGAGAGAQAAAPSTISTLYQVGFDASWELDLWGGVRRRIEAARANEESARAARHDALVSLAAEVARTYLSLRAAERQLRLAQDDLAAQERLAALAQSRYSAGFTSQSDVSAQQVQVEAARAQLPGLRQSIASARSQLTMLLALPPGALDQRLAAGAGAGGVPLPPTVAVGLPADLLRRRPDIRQREAELHAATAQVGVATSQLFPGVTLGLFGGLQATHAADLDDWASRFLIGGARVTVPIFQGGQLRAQALTADAQAQQALLAYRKTVLAAFHEADDAIEAYQEDQQQTAALQRQQAEARRAHGLAMDRWQRGLSSFIEVLQAERTLYQSERQAAQAQAQSGMALVALYKALGGGWQDGVTGSATADSAAQSLR